MRPDNPRIRGLLAEREELEIALQEACSPDEAASIRADLTAVQHSLWLAGYPLEEMA